MTKNALTQEQKGKYHIAAFIDDNQSHLGQANARRTDFESFHCYEPRMASKEKIDLLVIAIQSLDPVRKKEISELAINAGLEVKIVPAYRKWIEGKISAKQLKSVQIEDLLQRNKIELDSKNISGSVHGKLLSQVPAGSIGAEIARQLSYYNLEKLVLIDHAESPLYDLEQELKEKNRTRNTLNPICEVANVKDKYRMTDIFERYRPDIVYHAAAYKHVPIIEKSPYEIFVNVFGTRIVADLASTISKDS